jgi:hypothetical protein
MNSFISPEPRRLNRSEVRSGIRNVGVDTARILNIIYPARECARITGACPVPTIDHRDAQEAEDHASD